MSLNTRDGHEHGNHQKRHTLGKNILRNIVDSEHSIAYNNRLLLHHQRRNEAIADEHPFTNREAKIELPKSTLLGTYIGTCSYRHTRTRAHAQTLLKAQPERENKLVIGIFYYYVFFSEYRRRRRHRLHRVASGWKVVRCSASSASDPESTDGGLPMITTGSSSAFLILMSSVSHQVACLGNRLVGGKHKIVVGQIFSDEWMCCRYVLWDMIENKCLQSGVVWYLYICQLFAFRECVLPACHLLMYLNPMKSLSLVIKWRTMVFRLNKLGWYVYVRVNGSFVWQTNCLPRP